MQTFHALTEADIATFYLQSKGGADYLPSTADALVQDIERYLREHGLHHRIGDAVRIAIGAFEITKQIRTQSSVQSEAENAWQADLREGIGSRPRELDELAHRQMDELALASRVAAMDMATFTQNRARFGLAKTTADHLAGR